ncbi:MAG: transglutaminase, partial [Acidimicrobiia bacterium]|nr:transglutaminase [Acidimicrobiia bacterium]
MPPTVRTEVGCELAFDVDDRVELAVQVAVATTAGAIQTERLDVRVDGRPLGVDVLDVDAGGRVHV